MMRLIKSMILIISILVYLVSMDVLCSTACMDSFINSGFMEVKCVVILNETIITSSSIIRSLILWRHCGGRLMENPLQSVK